MKKLLSLVMAILMFAAMLNVAAIAEDVNLTDIVDFLPDEYPRLEDNFFAYVNWDVIKEAEIPAGQSLWRVSVSVSEEIKAELNGLLEGVLAKTGEWEKGTSEQKIADLYQSYIDMDSRNAAGLGSLATYLDRIQNASTIQEYIEASATNGAAIGGGGVLGFGLSTDRVDSTKYTVSMSTMSLGGLSQTYLDNPKMSSYWDLFKEHMTNLFVLYGVDAEEAAAKAEAIFELEQYMSSQTMSRAERSNPANTYNPKTLDELQAILSNIDVVPVLACYYSEEAGRGYETENKFVVSDLHQADEVNKLLVEDNLQLLKDYSTMLLLDSYEYYLTEDYRNESERYDAAYYGRNETVPLEEKSLEDVKSTLSWNIGEIYAYNFFKPEYKADIELMVEEMRNAYHEMIDSYDWMSEETKAGAHAKLNTLKVRIAYPDEGDWPTHQMDVDYAAPADGGILIDNILGRAIRNAKFTRSHLGQPVVSYWGMTPQTVNASYSSSTNAITFPAGILRGAYYNPERSHAANLGAIGAVIGHEMSHGFDNTGALYDAYGNYNIWWTDEDLETFTEKTKAVAAYYDTFEVWPGYMLNGTQTNGENIADLGALSCVSHILGDDKEALQEMFTAWAEVWACKMTYGELNSRMLTDEHATGIARVNATLSTTDSFYYAFDIKEGDGMYVAPEARVGIW